MPSYMTLFCPKSDSAAFIAAVSAAAPGQVELDERGPFPSAIIRAHGSAVTFNYLERQRPGDQYSNTVLGLYSRFKRVKTRNEAAQKFVLHGIANARSMVGVVIEPELTDDDARTDTILSLAEAFDVVVCVAETMVTASGDLLFDMDGDTEVQF